MVKKIFSFILSSFALSFTLLTLSVVFSYADTATHYQTTATKTTAVGTVSNGNATSLSDYASKLVQAIQTACQSHAVNFPGPGYVVVNTTTQSCLNQIPGNTIAKPVIDWLHLSTNNAFNGNLQCAGFVQAVSLGIGNQLPNGDANQYSSDKPGYKWYPAGGEQIREGDIPVWLPNHIAVVIHMDNPTHFRVAEANGGSGTVGVESYPTNNAYGLFYKGFLRKL